MANSAWLVLAAMAFNLSVAAVGPHRTAVTATIRDQLINIDGRITRSTRRSTLRLPTNLVPAVGSRCQGRRVGMTRMRWRKLDCLNLNLQRMQVRVHRKDI